LRVAFLGPAGTFTEEALRASAVEGVEDELPCSTVWEAVMAVQHGDAERAVVPIENSLEGSVTVTLDTLAVEAVDVRIVAEVVHPIRHCLVARPGIAADEVRRVISHPQALAQCERYLRDELAHAATGTAASTADAVRLVAESSEPWAALGSRLSAELYGCDVLAESVQDRDDNVTRFVWLARYDDPPTMEPDGPPSKTSVVFWGFNDVSPGALVDVLREFSERGINLTKIESRPRRLSLGHYMFFADLEGGIDDPPVREALDALGRRLEEVRVLGSYPAP
jgi:prephenate dehydratase